MPPLLLPLPQQEVSAKNQPAGGAGEESAVEKRGPLVPEERRRLMVASMCPEDIVSVRCAL